MNPMEIMRLRGAIDGFTKNHPKVPLFFNAATKEIDVGSVIEINLTTSEGKNICTNMQVTEADIELFRQLKNMKKM